MNNLQNEDKLLDDGLGISPSDHFSEELQLLENEFAEMKDLFSSFKTHYDDIVKDKNRGTLNFIQSQTANLVSLKGAMVNVIKERVNVKKNIMDAIIKEKSFKTKSGTGSSELATEMYKLIMQGNQETKFDLQCSMSPSMKFDNPDIEEMLAERIKEITGEEEIQEEDTNEEEIKVVVDSNYGIYVVKVEGENYIFTDDYEVPKFKVIYKEINGEIHAFDKKGNEYEIVDIS